MALSFDNPNTLSSGFDNIHAIGEALHVDLNPAVGGMLVPNQLAEDIVYFNVAIGLVVVDIQRVCARVGVGEQGV